MASPAVRCNSFFVHPSNCSLVYYLSNSSARLLVVILFCLHFLIISHITVLWQKYTMDGLTKLVPMTSHYVVATKRVGICDVYLDVSTVYEELCTERYLLNVELLSVR